MAVTLQPSSFQKSVVLATAGGLLSARGVTMQGAPSKRSARAAWNPERSLPAIGWAPTKCFPRIGTSCSARESFTLPASVTTAPGDGLGECLHRPDRGAEHDEIGIPNGVTGIRGDRVGGALPVDLPELFFASPPDGDRGPGAPGAEGEGDRSADQAGAEDGDTAG